MAQAFLYQPCQAWEKSSLSPCYGFLPTIFSVTSLKMINLFLIAHDYGKLISWVIGIPWATLHSPHHFYCVLNVINWEMYAQARVYPSIPLTSEPEGINPLWGKSHPPRARMGLWMRWVDGEGATYVKDATMPWSATSGTWTPDSRKHFPLLWIQLKLSVISQIFLWEWRHCSQSTWVSEYQLSCDRKGCFPSFPCEKPH